MGSGGMDHRHVPKEPDAKYTDGLIPLILVKNGQNQSMVIEVRVFILGVRVSGGPRREPGGGEGEVGHVRFPMWERLTQACSQ